MNKLDYIPHSLSVLLIDDDKDDRYIFCDIMKEIFPEIQCLTSDNGNIAIQNLSKTETRPLIIFLDLNMPGVSGKQVLERIKKDSALKRIPVVIYTNSRKECDILATTELGAAGFISKPYDAGQIKHDLHQIISKILGEDLLSKNPRRLWTT